MDTTIRNIDEEAYRKLRIYAAHHGVSMGEAFNQIVLHHGHVSPAGRPKVSIFSIQPWDWGPGTENTSQEIDEIVYGPEAQDVSPDQ